MPTEDDLRATLQTLEYQAPDPIGTLTGLDRLRRRRTTRRRVGALVAVVAATLAMVGGSLATRDLTQHPGSGGPVRPGIEYRFAVDDIAGYRTVYKIASPNRAHQAWVFPTGDTKNWLAINVFPENAYDPATVRAGEPVEVRGKPGFYLPNLQPPVGPKVTVLAWEYAPNTWALVEPHLDPEQQRADVKQTLIRIASAVRFDRTTPVRVPFRIGWLPDNVRLESSGDGSPKATMGCCFGQPDADLQFATTAPGTPELEVTMQPTDAWPDLPVGEPTMRTVPGENGTNAWINLGPFEVWLSSHPPRRTGSTTLQLPVLPVEELKKIARSITAVGDPHDVNTWVPVADALPR